MIRIHIKGRSIPLIYTVWEMKQVQEEIGPLNEAISLVLGRNPDDKEDSSKYGTPEHLEAAATLIRILGNAGLEEDGQEANLTEKTILRALKPVEFAQAINACMDAMNEGMSSEVEQEKPKGPVDVTLEEIRKKKETED